MFVWPELSQATSLHDCGSEREGGHVNTYVPSKGPPKGTVLQADFTYTPTSNTYIAHLPDSVDRARLCANLV